MLFLFSLPEHYLSRTASTYFEISNMKNKQKNPLFLPSCLPVLQETCSGSWSYILQYTWAPWCLQTSLRSYCCSESGMKVGTKHGQDVKLAHTKVHYLLLHYFVTHLLPFFWVEHKRKAAVELPSATEGWLKIESLEMYHKVK